MNPSNGMPFFRRALITFLILCSAGLVLANPATNNILQYSSRTWQTDEGLPHNIVQAIAQTFDGYLWIGTRRGLARFDGVRFTLFEEGRSITALCSGKDGRLWIGSDPGGVTCFAPNGTLHFSKGDGLPSDSVRSLFEARDGALWIGTTNGLSRYHAGQFTNFSENEGLSHSVVRSICEDSEGTIYIATPRGINRWKNGKISERLTMANGLVSDVTRVVYTYPSNALWIGSVGGLNQQHNGRMASFTKTNGLSDMIVTALCGDRHNTLWVGTYGGLDRVVNGNIVTEKHRDGTAYDMVNALIEDREGNIWIGTKDGLHRLSVQRFSCYTQQHGLTHNNVMSVYEDKKGVLWVGTWGGGLNQFKDGAFSSTWRELINDNSFALDLVLGLHEDRDRLWVGLDYDGGMFSFHKGRSVRYSRGHGLTDPSVRVIHRDRNQFLWIGTSGSLCRMRGGTTIRYTKKEGLAGDTVRAILEDHQGRLWVGCNEGLTCISSNTFKNFTTHDGLSDNAVLALYEDAEKTLWIGTESGGLNAYQNGKFFHCTTKQGLFSNSIFEILEDDQGYFWMSSNTGIFRISRKNLVEFIQGRRKTVTSISYGREDGMATIQCNNVAKPAALKGRDGRLWFATTKGLVTVTPGMYSEIEASPPPVVIEEVIADKKVYGPGVTLAGSTLNVPPGSGELEFHYTSLSFTAPEKNQFKYKLEGVDSDWVEAKTRRVAYYNNLRPGSYVFHVRACNNNGVWNDVGSKLGITLQPQFWQTMWFATLIGLSSITLVAGSVRYITKKRMKEQLERLEQQHALERERLRIARDMHDHLGLNLTQMGLLGEMTRRDSANAAEVKAHAAKISAVARELSQSVDAIVWAVNPKNDTLNRLSGYLASSTEEVCKMADIRCRVEVPAQLPERPVSAEFRHNLFLVVKEALNNALRHSQASEIRFQLAFTQDQLAVEVADNGKGFQISTADEFGNGLANMKKRMMEIGGRFTLQSEPGKGTHIRVEVPLPG